MAGPVNPNQFDPDRIDISLDLVGAGSLEAVQQLTEQLRTLNVFNATIQARSPEGMADNAATLSQTVGRRGPSGVQEGFHPNQSRPENSPAIKDGAGRLTSAIGQYAQRERDQYDHRVRLGMGGDIDPYGSIYSGRDGGVDQQLAMGSRGRPSSGASLPNSDLLADEPIWRQALTANPVEWERSQEGVRLPPGGLSLNIQDKLRIASDFLARRAERQYQSVASERNQQMALAAATGAPPDAIDPAEFGDLSNVGAGQGNIAALLRIGSEHAAQAQLVFGDARNAVARAYNYAGGFQQAGVAAGYQRAGQINIPGTNIGVTNPLDFFKSDSAAREGLRQRVDSFRLRLMGGIDGQQAQQIVGSLAGLGWTGQQGDHMAFDALAPLTQQGLDPALTSESLDMAVRQGNASLGDFVTTMNHLGDSAKASNLSLSEYQQGLMEFAQAAGQVGATPLQGMQLGRGLTDATGVAPQVAATWLTNPLVQAGAMRQGLLPNEVGLMGTNQALGSVYTGMDMAMNATQQFRNMPIRDPQTGKMISGADRQIVQAAAIMGMPVNEFRRLRREQTVSAHAGRAEDLLKNYGAEAHRADQIASRWHDHTSQHGAYSVGKGGGFVSPQATATQARHDREVKDVYDQVEGPHSDWGRVHNELMAMVPKSGPKRDTWIERIKEIEKQHGAERIHSAEKFVRDRIKTFGGPQKDNAPTVHVKFTGAAAKFFEQDSKASAAKAAAKAGGPALTESILHAPSSEAAQTMMQDWFKQNISTPGQ